jgi:hypothetical protein
MSDPLVTVYGPGRRHIEVHKSTQEALPDAFPLVPAKPAPSKRSAAKKASPKRTSTVKTAPVEPVPGTPDSTATADETATVETPKEAD